MIPAHFLDEEDSDLKWAPGFGPAKWSPAASDEGLPTKVQRRVRLLLVEDSSVDAHLVQLALKNAVGITFEVVIEATVTKAVERLASGGFDIVLLDLGLPDSWGLETFRKVREHASEVPILVLSGNADEEIAVQAIHQGAQDYLLKGFDTATLTRSIRYAMSRHRMRRKIQRSLDVAKISEASLRMIIEKNLDGVVVVNHEGLVVHANAAAEKLFAYPAGRFEGKHFPVPVTPNSTRETDIVNCLSQVVPTELRFAAIEWAGQPAWLALLRDLTEHKRALSTQHKLEIAREVQQRLLPQTAPNLIGFDIAGASISADETGGDYFDYFPMADGTISFVVADASGHGIGAALFISNVSATLRAFSSITSDPGEILRRTARSLGPRIPEGQFVTTVLARVDPARDVLTYASAGHPSALVIDRDGEVRVDLTSLDFPIGLDPDCQFQTSPETPFHAGDTLVLISDGIIEAMGYDGSMFGKQRIIETIRQFRHESAQTIVAMLLEAVRSHCAPQAPADDLTVVVVKNQ